MRSIGINHSGLKELGEGQYQMLVVAYNTELTYWMRGTLMSINYFRQYELRNRDIVTLAPAHEVNGISITHSLRLASTQSQSSSSTRIDRYRAINKIRFFVGIRQGRTRHLAANSHVVQFWRNSTQTSLEDLRKDRTSDVHQPDTSSQIRHHGQNHTQISNRLHLFSLVTHTILTN